MIPMNIFSGIITALKLYCFCLDFASTSRRINREESRDSESARVEQPAGEQFEHGKQVQDGAILCLERV